MWTPRSKCMMLRRLVRSLPAIAALALAAGLVVLGVRTGGRLPRLADLDRTARALAFAPRPANGSQCKLHHRRLQFASDEAAALAGIAVEPVARAAVSESVSAPGEVVFDPTRVARVAPRLAGVVWRVEKQPGDAVRRGEVLAVLDSAEAGRVRADFRQTQAQRDLKARTLSA